MQTIREIGNAQQSDDALVAAARCGEKDAFGKLVSRYEPRVLAVAQRITKNREDAEDVVQDAFHNAFRHLKNFRNESRFSTWLTPIAVNEALMLLRKKRRAVEVLAESTDSYVNSASMALADRGPTPEQWCWHRERTESLTKAINRLGPTIRKTIVVGDIQEHSVEETAGILGASISAVKSRLSRGRRELVGGVESLVRESRAANDQRGSGDGGLRLRRDVVFGRFGASLARGGGRL
jgi:RNA polymerase sigma-70 factor, ECF subfamily